jgi:hypothetical protein
MEQSGLFDETEMASITDEDIRQLHSEATRQQSFARTAQRAVDAEKAAKLEIAQRVKANEAYAHASAGDFTQASLVINNSPYDSDWKIAQNSKMSQAVKHFQETQENSFEVDTDKDLRATLWSKVFQGTATKRELDDAQGAGISTSTYVAMMTKLQSGPAEDNVYIKQRLDDIDSLLSVPTETKGKKTLAAQQLVRLGVPEHARAGIIAVGGITSFVQSVGRKALTEWAVANAADAKDPAKIEKAWLEIVLPKMFTTPDPQTGRSWLDHWITRFVGGPVTAFFRGRSPASRPLKPSNAPAQPPNTLDKETATAILDEAGGDRDKARQIAKERGYEF